MFKTLKTLCIAGIAAFCAYASMAQDHPPALGVQGAWVRATVAGQSGTGAFMTLTAREDLRLVGVSSPAAGVAEIHEMKMGANNVMEMRPVTELALPKGRAVELKPGGYHLMLMSLKQPLLKGSQVSLTLRLKNSKGEESKLQLTAPALPSPAQRPSEKDSQPMPMDHHKH